MVILCDFSPSKFIQHINNLSALGKNRSSMNTNFYQNSILNRTKTDFSAFFQQIENSPKLSFVLSDSSTSFHAISPPAGFVATLSELVTQFRLRRLNRIELPDNDAIRS